MLYYFHFKEFNMIKLKNTQEFRKYAKKKKSKVCKKF